jgi:hypothetical protein
MKSRGMFSQFEVNFSRNALDLSAQNHRVISSIEHMSAVTHWTKEDQLSTINNQL